MTSSYTPTTVAQGFGQETAINTNFTSIKTALDESKSRISSTSESMQVDLDMNSNDVLNASSINTAILNINGTQVSTTALSATNLARFYQTVALMKAATDISPGDTVLTQGYTTAGDGGGAEYFIQTSGAFGGSPDEKGDHTLATTDIAVLQLNEVVVDVRKYGADPTGVVDATTSIQAAIDTVPFWIAYPGTFKISSSLTIDEKQIHMGSGRSNTAIDGTSLAAGTPAFIWETANGTVDRAGVTICRMSINAKTGIRINNSANGFTGDGTSQENILGCVFQDLIINGSDKTGNGIELSKCFEVDISRNWVLQNDYAVRLNGCDTGVVARNRFQSNLTACYREDGHNTFGSNMTVEDNFMANLADGGIAHIMSSNRAIRIFRNQIEQTTVPTPLLSGAIQIFNNGTVDGLQSVQINFNQLLVSTSTCTNLIDFDTVEWQYLSCIYNDSIKGPARPVANFNGDVNYWFNTLARRIITVEGSENIVPPFNSSERPFATSSGIEFSPNLPGMTPGLQGTSTVVENGAFKLPPVAAAGHSIVLSPKRTGFGQHDGIISTKIVAKGVVAGQTLSIQWTKDNGASSILVVTLPLTTEYAEYKIFGPFDQAGADADKEIRLFNQDTTNNSNVFVKSCVLAIDHEDISDTTANLASLTSFINTAGKFTGRLVYNTTTNTPVWSDGSAAASVWVDATGSTAHTPV